MQAIRRIWGKSPSGWTVQANNYSSGSPLSDATAYALCLK